MNRLDTFIWNDGLMDPSGVRLMKPRSQGMTMVIDKGLGISAFSDLLSLSSPYIDFIKLGFGTSALYPPPILQKKIHIAQERGINLYPGGTFFEVAYQQHEITSYFESLRNLGFDYVEISDGTITLTHKKRCQLIAEAISRGFQVITECGKKVNGFVLSVDELEDTLYSDLECGATYVIVEGRETGKNAGIYNIDGDLDEDFLKEIKIRISSDLLPRLIWEAPLKKQQVCLIESFGRNVNIGNIPGLEVFSLECLRRGLRSDTFPVHG